MIYFIQAGADGDIKIGFTAAKDPMKRLKAFQTGHFAKLRLLGTIPGSIQDEQSIHRELRRYGTTGEWFRSDPELMRKIDRVIEGQSPWQHFRELRSYSWKELEKLWHSEIVIPTQEMDDKSSYEDCAYTIDYQGDGIRDEMRRISEACRLGLMSRERRNHRMHILGKLLKRQAPDGPPRR